jgi:hypothetical protein
MAALEVMTHIGSIYGMIELKGILKDNGNGHPKLVINEVVGEHPECFDSLLGAYAPGDIIEGVVRPEMAPNMLQTYPQPANFAPVHLARPPETKEEKDLARRAFVNAFSDNSGFRPGSETVGWLYGEPAKRIFEHPTACNA